MYICTLPGLENDQFRVDNFNEYFGSTHFCIHIFNILYDSTRIHTLCNQLHPTHSEKREGSGAGDFKVEIRIRISSKMFRIRNTHFKIFRIS